MAKESKYASVLRQNGFVIDEKMTAGSTIKGPLFMASPPGSEPITLVNDEEGQVWILHGKSMDLTPFGFISMWHPILTPLRAGFLPAPDFPEKEKLYLPAYFNWNFDGQRITMAVDEDGKCWQAPGEIDLSQYGFFEHDSGTWERIRMH